MRKTRKTILALCLSLLMLPFGLLSSITVEASSNPTVTYRTHVQREGWQSWRINGAMSGTTGRALRLEGIELNLQGNGGIRYRTHVQRVGWQDWRSNGQAAGTTGQALRLEGIQIELMGAVAQTHHVEYRVTVPALGGAQQGWVRNGAVSGTTGRGLMIQGIQIRLVPRGNSAPGTVGVPMENPAVVINPPQWYEPNSVENRYPDAIWHRGTLEFRFLNGYWRHVGGWAPATMPRQQFYDTVRSTARASLPAGEYQGQRRGVRAALWMGEVRIPSDSWW